MICNRVLNNCTYLWKPTLRGNIACTKRFAERVRIDIKFTMNRLTNPYNLMVGSEVPLVCSHNIHVSGVSNYVVLESPVQPKQPALSKGIVRRSSKVNIRRISIELGISRNTKVWGRRRIHSTTFTCGKGSSFSSASSHQLSGFYKDAQLDILINDAKNNKLCTNLSYLMSKPDFLIACWVKIRSNKRSLTPALNKKSTLNGIDKRWFLNISNCIMNGSFEFQPYRKARVH